MTAIAGWASPLRSTGLACCSSTASRPKSCSVALRGSEGSARCVAIGCRILCRACVAVATGNVLMTWHSPSRISSSSLNCKYQQ
eukprot:5832-Heterococcus_DN1.PRE.3